MWYSPAESNLLSRWSYRLRHPRESTYGLWHRLFGHPFEYTELVWRFHSNISSATKDMPVEEKICKCGLAEYSYEYASIAERNEFEDSITRPE